jgi:hypothetical protein
VVGRRHRSEHERSRSTQEHSAVVQRLLGLRLRALPDRLPVAESRWRHQSPAKQSRRRHTAEEARRGKGSQLWSVGALAAHGDTRRAGAAQLCVHRVGAGEFRSHHTVAEGEPEDIGQHRSDDTAAGTVARRDRHQWRPSRGLDKLHLTTSAKAGPSGGRGRGRGSSERSIRADERSSLATTETHRRPVRPCRRLQQPQPNPPRGEPLEEPCPLASSSRYRLGRARKRSKSRISPILTTSVAGQLSQVARHEPGVCAT